MAQQDIYIGGLAFVDVTFVNLTFKFIFGSHLPVPFRLNIVDMPMGVGNDVSALDKLTWERIKYSCLVNIP